MAHDALRFLADDAAANNSASVGIAAIIFAATGFLGALASLIRVLRAPKAPIRPIEPIHPPEDDEES